MTVTLFCANIDVWLLKKTCTKCFETKPLEDFHIAARGSAKRRADCKNCVKTRMQSTSAENHTKYLKTRNVCECGSLKTRYSVKCKNCARSKSTYDNPSWREDKDGYIVASIVDDFGVTRHTSQHRLVMERHVGRRLFSQESVHHKNGIRDDNRLENLELWSCSHPSGQRIEDKIEWCRWFLAQYEEV